MQLYRYSQWRNVYIQGAKGSFRELNRCTRGRHELHLLQQQQLCPTGTCLPARSYWWKCGGSGIKGNHRAPMDGQTAQPGCFNNTQRKAPGQCSPGAFPDLDSVKWKETVEKDYRCCGCEDFRSGIGRETENIASERDVQMSTDPSMTIYGHTHTHTRTHTHTPTDTHKNNSFLYQWQG